jgi:hypothetical protein
MTGLPLATISNGAETSLSSRNYFLHFLQRIDLWCGLHEYRDAWGSAVLHQEESDREDCLVTLFNSSLAVKATSQNSTN